MKLASPQREAGSMQALDSPLKMEDRKRPAADEPRNVHPQKRQAITPQVNGAHPDADMPWKESLEEFTKDAVYRQMREWRRTAGTATQEVEDMREKIADHDYHVRKVDEWFLGCWQYLADTQKGMPQVSEYQRIDGPLLNSTPEEFDKHLDKKAADMIASFEQAFAKYPGVAKSADELRPELTKLRQKHHDYDTELAMLKAAKEQVEHRLEDASYRYMVAEKKIDRLKSPAVQKMEAAARGGPSKQESEGAETAISGQDQSAPSNGIRAEELQKLEAEKNAAVALKEKMGEQIDSCHQEISRLKEKLAMLELKQGVKTDEDYAHTDLYKRFHVQHEDVIKRVNDLQASNSQLREEVKKMYNERVSFKSDVDKESQEAVMDAERQLGQAEADLARIRKARDELQNQLNLVVAEHQTDKESAHHADETLRSQAKCIESLERQLVNAQNQDMDEMKEAYAKELKSMGEAVAKFQTAAIKKYSTLVEAEQRQGKAQAEKVKAEQKYFAAMKAKDAQAAELKANKLQNYKSAEIISQLKEAESDNRTLSSALQKQIAELKDHVAQLKDTSRNFQQEAFNNKQKVEELTAQKAEVEAQVKKAPAASHTNLVALHKAEQELAELQTRYDAAQKSLETYRVRSVGAQGAEFEVLKGIATCAVCRYNFKNTALRTCGHVFCEECVQERVSNRARKCPNCNKPFGNGDIMRVTL